MSKKELYTGILLIFLLSVLLTGCRQTEEQPQPEASQSVTETILIPEPEPEPPPQPDYVAYPGFIDQHFDTKHHTLSLYNDKVNTVSLRFSLTDSSGEVLFASEPVPPGEKTSWDVNQRWTGTGHHQLTILTTPLSPDGTEGNSVRQTIKIYLEN